MASPTHDRPPPGDPAALLGEYVRLMQRTLTDMQKALDHGHLSTLELLGGRVRDLATTPAAAGPSPQLSELLNAVEMFRAHRDLAADTARLREAMAAVLGELRGGASSKQP